MQLSIGELAKNTGVSVRAIRHYDNQGLLTSSRSCNGYRWFPQQAVAQVRQIQRLIVIGFTIAEIRSFPDCMRLIEGASLCPETLELRDEKLKKVEQQITELERQRARLMATLSAGADLPADK